MKTKKLIALLLALVMVVGLLPTMALAHEKLDPVITYTLNNVTVTADLTEIGTWTPASSYANSKVYLASLPFGASVASYAVGDYTGLAHMVYGLNTSNRKDDAALTDSENYLTNEKFVGTGLASDVQYFKTALGKLDDASSTKAQIATSNVKGYGLRITGLTGFSPLIIVQISTDNNKPIITYQDSSNQKKIADLSAIGTWTPASSYANSKVYLASLPYGASVISYAVGDYTGLAHMVYGLNTSNRKDDAALTDSDNYLANEQFIGTGLALDVQYNKTALGKLDDASTTKVQIPTSNVKGYGLRITGLTGFSPLVIIQISSVENSGGGATQKTVTAGDFTVTYTSEGTASFTEIGTWDCDKEGEPVYLLTLPDDAKIDSVAIVNPNSYTVKIEVAGKNDWMDTFSDTDPYPTKANIAAAVGLVTDDEFVTGADEDGDGYAWNLSTITTGTNKIPSTLVTGYMLCVYLTNSLNSTMASPGIIVQYANGNGGPVTTYLDTTELAEAIRLNNIYYPVAKASQYTTASWTAYRAVMDPAEAFLVGAASLEDTDENRETRDNHTVAVQAQATNHVPDKKLSTLDTTANARLSDAQMAYAGLKYLRNNLFNPQKFTASKYENWSAFSTACDTASTFLTSHNAAALTLENGVNEALSYKDAYQAFWTASYGLTGTAENITVTLDMTDTYARIKDADPIAGGKRVLTLQKGASIEDALNAAGLSITALNNRLGNNTYLDPFHMIGLYVNGIYTQYGIIQESFPAAMTNRIVLNDGDHILIALMNAPFNTSSSGSGADPAGLNTVGDSIRYAYFQQNGKEITSYTAASGADIALTTAGYTALPTHYSGRVSGLAGAEIYRSEAYATEADARAATASISTGTVTGADGSFSLKLYSAEGKTEGWYLLNVLSADKNQGLTNAPNLLVHVTDPDDLGAIRTDLTNKLNAIYTAYDEDFYTADQLSQVQAYYAAAAAVLSAGTGTSGDLSEAYETARAGITAIQAVNEANLSKCLANVRELLKYLPNAADVQAGKLFDADKTVLDLLFGADGWYARMTPYQQGQFTSSEAKVIKLLKEKYESSNQGANLPQLPAFTLTVEVRDADTNEIVDLPVFDSASVSIVSNLSYNERTGQFSGSGGNSGRLHFNANTTSYTLPSTLPANGYYWLTISANVDRNQLAGYSYVGFAFSFDDSYILDENGTTYLLRENATKTCYVRSANTLSAAKQQALADLKTAYQSHIRSKYSAENWATLTQAYQDGVTAINNAADATAVQKALNDATDAMAAVEQDKQQTGGVPGWGEGSPFNVGAKVGTVTVTAENNTYKGGAFVGKLFEDKVNYAIGANDTMMTVILRALHDAGYTWEGTGGETIDGYDIDYLAKVKKDGKELGEFSGDPGSGWMGALNDFMVNEGFQGFSVAAGSLSDGDTISLMYTQNLGEDLGGTWGNSDTTLKSLVVNDGALTLIPSFSPGEPGGSYDYALMIPGSFANLSFVPSATNKNYYVKMFLNEKVTDNTEGNSYYKRTETIPVHVGDIVYIGVGERDWPSMNKVGSEARFYTATWYAVHILSANDGASVVNSMIAKLPAVTYSNYKDVAAQVKNIEQIKATLSATEQAKVNSLDTVKKDIKFYEDIDAVKTLLAALPKSANMSDAQVTAAKAQIEEAYAAYEKLTKEQQDYITVGDAANYNALVERLKELTPTTSAQTIVGSEKKKEDEGSEIAPAQVAVAPEVVNGEAKAEIAAEDVSKAIEEAPDAKTLTVKVETEGADKVEASLPADAVKAAAIAGVGLNVETENGTVKLSAADVKAAGGKDLAVSVKENADGSTTIGVTAGGKTVDTKVKVELPAAKDGQVLVIVNADGTEEVVKKCVTSDGKVYAEIPAGAKVKVADAQGMSFGDVKETDWFAGAVEFVTSRGIFQGTGDGFQPNAPMNRAMLVTVLQRIAGEKARGENTFGDVESDAWYADAVIWASENGIVNGTDNGFEPDEPVTREQIATMLYRFMKYLGYDVSASKALDGFPDGDTADWAKEGMQWAAGVGLFQGDQNGNLNPGGKATRAEVATLAERLIGLMVK